MGGIGIAEIEQETAFRHDHAFDPLGLTVDTTLAEFMAWREEHAAEECMEALGLPQATYYRKLKQIKMYAHSEDMTLGDID